MKTGKLSAPKKDMSGGPMMVGSRRNQPTNRPSCQPPKIRPSCSLGSADRQTDRHASRPKFDRHVRGKVQTDKPTFNC